MRPANEGDLLKKPHVYVKRADGSSGYEPVAEVVSEAPVALPAADLDAAVREPEIPEVTADSSPIRVVRGSKAK